MELRWIQKAVLTSPDFDGVTTPGLGGYLSPQQVLTFLRLAIDETVIMNEARIETDINPKFEVPRISMNDRILRPGTQATRVLEADRVKPATGLMSLSTVLLKGEVPVSDEVFEDQVERGALADTIMEMVAQAVGRDVEEIAIKSDTVRDPGGTDPAADAVLDLLEGLVKSATTNFVTAQKVDCSALTTPEAVFRKMLEALPDKYRRQYTALRYYTSITVKDRYHDSLTKRGTALGDTATTSNLTESLAYRSIPVRGVPLLSGASTVNGAAINYSKYAFLTDPRNIVFGFQRRIRIERFRDPREGATSILPTLRFDVDWANPEASVMGYGIDLPE